MNAENFTYWLQGAFELGQFSELNVEQTKVVRDHLNLVFNKVTPQYGITSSPIVPAPVVGSPGFTLLKDTPFRQYVDNMPKIGNGPDGPFHIGGHGAFPTTVTC